MIETPIRLKLPIRQIVAGTANSPAPTWIAQQHRRAEMARLQSAKSAAAQREEVQRRHEHEAHRATWLAAANQLRKAQQSLTAKWEQLRPEFQQAVIELAHAVAAKLVLDQVAAGQFPIENLVREVIGRLSTDQTIVVRLHPLDFEQWQRHVLRDELVAEQHPRLKVQADSAIARGDCQAASGEISILYELQRQIDELRQQLVSAVSGHQ